MADRFQIATGNVPEPPEPVPPEARIRTFGIDEDVTGNSESRASRMEFFRGHTGQEPQIAFVQDPSYMFVGTKAHWAGRQYVVCKGSDVNNICCRRFGRARWRMGAVIFRYNAAVNEQNPRGTIMPWVFSERVYNQLREANNSFPLSQHDYRVRCTNDRFQILEFVPLSTHISQDFIVSRESEINNAREEITRALGSGSDLTEEEILNLVDTAPPPSRPYPQTQRTTRAMDSPDDDDFFELLDSA